MPLRLVLYQQAQFNGFARHDAIRCIGYQFGAHPGCGDDMAARAAGCRGIHGWRIAVAAHIEFDLGVGARP
ncbi:hypothetical protein D3C72_2432150 [compost metagenome]